MDIHSLREYLIHQRRSAGWTQEELSEKSGVSVRTIRNLETGVNTNPRRTSVNLLLNAFGTSVPTRPGPRVPLGGWPAESPKPGGAGGPQWQGPRPAADQLVGRQHDVRHLLTAVQRSRFVLLTGPAGVGKTRLALAVAERLLPLFPGGVEVTPLHDCPPEHLNQQRAAAHLTRITAKSAGAMAPETTDSGTAKQLLILDGAEHVPQEVAWAARGLLDANPRLHIIATSRRTLAMGTAETWEVEPLRTELAGDDGQELPGAVELLLRRLQSTLPTLDLSSHLPQVSRLCGLLDGIPLAIEIAAQRLRSLPLTSLLHERTLLHLLDRVDAGDLSRHRTLSDSVRWSYDLLPPPHRALLHRLVNLPKSFSLEDVLAVQHSGDPSRTPRIAHLLAELADASLVQIHRDDHYDYSIHALVRHFVLARTDETPTTISLRRSRPETHRIDAPLTGVHLPGVHRPAVMTRA